MQPTHDLALLDAWRKERDADAFSELVSRYAGMVYATSRRVLKNSDDAEDVAQECFLALAELKADVHSSLAGWLRRIAIAATGSAG